jgi:regulatory protein YycI of two-component signal transduction system YycFG
VVFSEYELRSLSDARVLSFDFITLDDGEANRRIDNAVTSSAVEKLYKRTFLLEDGKVVYKK